MIFDHVGVFVRDLAEGQQRLGRMLPIVRWTEPVDDPVLNVRIRFGIDASGICYELVAPFGPGGPVERALASGENLLNHVAYRVADLDGELARLRRERCIPTGAPRPAVAFGGRRVVFVLTPLRFVVELIEDSA